MRLICRTRNIKKLKVVIFQTWHFRFNNMIHLLHYEWHIMIASERRYVFTTASWRRLHTFKLLNDKVIKRVLCCHSTESAGWHSHSQSSTIMSSSDLQTSTTHSQSELGWFYVIYLKEILREIYYYVFWLTSHLNMLYFILHHSV